MGPVQLLLALTVLPLAVIAAQLGLDLAGQWGVAGYSLYKLFFLIPPLIYCRVHGVRVIRDILKPAHAKRGLGAALGIGGLAAAVFWTLYLLLGDVLLDKAMIVEKMADQFHVTLGTVFLIAPFTILANSLLEEFFYRGFAFGLLVRKHRRMAYVLPAAAFTVQHALFMREWLAPVPLAIAVTGLLAFAVLLQRIYETADSLAAPWLIHALGDVAMMCIAVAMLLESPQAA